ncbi:MAG: HlyD family type I secretion periplasmic adaptor subunit [Rhodocyclaceae bacterium]|nr:HlyD family type I secretion periplasmic adaptor subunit [Rhodocyclaceae bacterium]
MNTKVAALTSSLTSSLAAARIHTQALRDLWQRYSAIFRAVWAQRKQLDPAPRLPHEAAFLPAALELQETPVSPAPRIAMWMIISFAALALLWSIFGRIDVVATAQGKIVPSDRTKVIQPLETAMVKAIHVSDGQTVKAGDVLIELDATNAQADTTRTANDELTARLQALRAQGLLASLTSGKMPVLTSPQVGDGGTAINGDSLSAERLAQEQRLLDGQYSEYQAKLSRIEAEIAKREAELASTQTIVRRLEQTAPIARQRAQDFKDLVDKNFISKHGFLEKEQVRIETEGELATQQSRLRELAAALMEAKAQRTALLAETRRLALDSLNEAAQKSTSYGQELVKNQARGRTLTLIAPVDGTVQQRAVHTVGGVVTPAQALMMVVPQDHALEVEAFLENKDIGFVNPDQHAEVKIETFSFTKYGTIPATVTHVSHDAINDEKRGLIYSSRVQLARSTMRLDDKTVNLSPGMAVTVEIKTGRRRVIEYFLSPLLQHTNESLRER